MEYKVSIFNFDSKEYSQIINAIKNAPNSIEKERFFKRIAEDILRKEGFEKITEGPPPSQFKGVPFDFIAMKNGCLSLIELKGTMDTFNYSKEAQFLRLSRVVSELEKKEIKSSVFLLPINLKFSLYQILDSTFYDIIFENINKSHYIIENISDIVKDLIEKMANEGVKLCV